MINLPNKAFDIEYSTEWRKEVEFLKDHGIEPTFTKRKEKYPVMVYKYKKTPELFIALTQFYLSKPEKRVNNDDTVKAEENG